MVKQTSLPGAEQLVQAGAQLRKLRLGGIPGALHGVVDLIKGNLLCEPGGNTVLVYYRCVYSYLP